MTLASRDEKYKYLFGPIISRRLGVSLGVDLVPPKTCSLDCIYCEAGATTEKISVRKEFFPIEEIKSEIDNFLSSKTKVDFITFSGAGEPTLHSKIGELIRWLKKEHSAQKVCLITNGILIGSGNMPEELAGLDLVIPSLDAPDERTFKLINRPPKGITLLNLVESIKNFRSRNKCQMWLEIFIVPGLNDSKFAIANFAKIVSEIKPDKVQLNGLDRPGVEKWIEKPKEETIERFKKELSYIVPVETIVRSLPSAKIAKRPNELEDAIVKMILRRPCTEEEISEIFSIDLPQTKEIVKRLISSGRFTLRQTDTGIFITKN